MEIEETYVVTFLVLVVIPYETLDVPVFNNKTKKHINHPKPPGS